MNFTPEQTEKLKSCKTSAETQKLCKKSIELTEEQLESVTGGVTNSLLLEEGRKLGVDAICAVMKSLSGASLTPAEQAWVDQAYENARLIESLS